MQDVYDFFFDVNGFLAAKGLGRLEDTLRKAILSGMLSDMLTASMAAHARTLVENRHHNGHPDLVVQGVYSGDAVKAGTEGVEIKTTLKKGGAVDTHGARDQWFCVFVYKVDTVTEPAADRDPLRFTEVYLAEVTTADFRRNERGELGTRTATLHAEGVAKLRQKLGLSGPRRQPTRIRLVVTQLGNRGHRKPGIGRISLDAHAAIADMLRGGQRRARAGERIEHNTGAERQDGTHYLAEERLRLEAGMRREPPLRSARGG